ncbi:MAG: C39 family peptidase, partial [Chloroflexi bacterium]|nr:C39 family peptidase [Chloroflexota bacterium]
MRLADAFDNGKRKDGKECIYAYNFDIAPTSSVDTRGLTLYEYGNDAEPLKAAIADGRLRDTTVTGKDRLDAVYDRDNNWTLVAQRVIRDMAGVPEYKWRRGCSPTSAAMIMGYWDQSHPNMWPGTPPSSNDAHNDADPVNQVIEHLGVLMWTSSEGATRPLRIPGAMTEFAKEKGYSFIAGIKCVSDSQCSGMEGLSFAYLKKEIDAGRPMEIKLDTPAGFHSVVAYGYQDFPGTYDDYFAVRDTWWTGDPNHNGVVFKLEDGIEWWKWATDTTQPYYLYMGTFFSPANSAHEHYGLLESSFQSAGDFQEAFSVRAGASGGASLVTLANEPQESVLRMEAAGSTGPDDCIVSSPVSTPEQFKVSFLYAFETLGTLEVLLDGLLLAELADATGLGQVDDSGDFRSFSQEFSLLDYGLDPTLCHEFSLKLLAGSDHVLYVDNLLVCDPLATPLPEPTTLALLALGGLAL